MNRSFNGAMPFQAWILKVYGGRIDRFLKLQWGHALSGMDTSRDLTRTMMRKRLQWGHALSGMDTPKV